jgi:hypothetical protein
MVTDLRYPGILIVAFITLSLVLVGARNTDAQMSDLQEFFSAEYGGVSLRVAASQETVPGGNMTIEVMINGTADGVQIEYLNVSVYGFINGREQIQLNSTIVMADTPLEFNETTESKNTIIVPNEVWGITYGQILLRYTLKDLSYLQKPGFPLTTVRNVYLENLESQFRNLNQSHSLLSESFRNLTTEFDNLSQTYTELQGNYSQLQVNAVDLDNTRRVAVILTITTVFFVATTFYLVMRRPKEYW